MAYGEDRLSGKTIFEGRVFTVTQDEIRLVNGHTATREVVHHSGGAAVVALNDRQEVALVRQFRYAAGQEMTELPAGKIEKGEEPRQTATRELAEEAGLAADNFISFGQVIPTCAYCTEIIYLYLATGLHPVPQQLDADEFLDVFWVSLDEAVEMVMDGRIADAKTVSGLLRVKRLLELGQIQL